MRGAAPRIELKRSTAAHVAQIDVCSVTRYIVRVGRFRDEATRSIRDGEDTKAARAILPVELHSKAAKTIDRVVAAGGLQDLRVPPGNKLEKLSGDREGQFSIRINDQYRICFVWTEDGARQIEICDCH
jgi:proteic killer suppression protein